MKRWQFASLMVMILAAFLAVTRFSLQVSESWLTNNNIWTKERARQSLAAIPKMERSAPLLTAFLGSSEIEIGFDPQIFDREMSVSSRPSVSYNFAVRNVGAIFPFYLQRFHHEFSKHKIKPHILFINMAPSRLTHRATVSLSEQLKNHDLPTVYFDTAIWNELNLSFFEKGLIWIDKYLFGERRPGQLSFFLSESLRTLVGRNESDRRLADFWHSPRFHPEPAWDESKRGQFYWNLENEPALQASFGVLQSDEGFDFLLERYDACCDFLGLDLNEGYLEEVALYIKKMKENAERVILVHLSENPRLVRSEKMMTHLTDITTRLAASSGVEVWFAGELEKFEKDDYIDVIHFSPKGAQKFSAALARKLKTENK